VGQLADRVARSVLNEGDVEAIVQQIVSGQRRVASITRQGFAPGEDLDDRLIPAAPNTIFDLGAVDQRALGKGSRDRMYELQAAYPARVADALGVRPEVVRQAHDATDTLILASIYLGKQPEELDYYHQTWRPTWQAMDSATTAEGLEFVPKELSGSLIERVNLQLMVTRLFPAVRMLTQPFEIPGLAVGRQRTGTKHKRPGTWRPPSSRSGRRLPARSC
jgi:hypothetical protein